MKTGYASIPERLHLVITGETGRPLSFVLRRDRIAAFVGAVLFAFVLLAAGSWAGVVFFRAQRALAAKAASQAAELDSFHADFAVRIQQAIADREKRWKAKSAAYEAALKKLETETAASVRQLRDECKLAAAEQEKAWQEKAAAYEAALNNLKTEKDASVSRLRNEQQQTVAAQEQGWKEKAAAYEATLKKLKTETAASVSQLQDEQKKLIRRHEAELAVLKKADAAKLADLSAELDKTKKARQQLLEKTAGRLDERSRIIESMMNNLGIDVKVSSKKKDANSGGPFLAASLEENYESYSQQLLSRSDRYIAFLQKMPLGLPMKGSITSRFGQRTDPINQRLAFHAGTDFKGQLGDTVRATADGVVKQSGDDAGGFGLYLVVAHGNGYETLFGHLNKKLVNPGDTIKRGDAIGEMGNTGRSTGPHLHYEVHYQGRAVDPEKYLAVAKLSFTVHM